MAKQYLDYEGLQVVWGQVVARDEAEATARALADEGLDERLDAVEASLGNGGSIGTRVGTLESEMDAAQDDIDALEALHATGKTVAQEVSDGITALNLANTYAGKAYEGKVDTLIGSDTGKSARTIAAEELAAQLIPENADEARDTLAEIAAWIQSHPGDAATMNAAISALQTKTTLGNDPETGDEYTTVKGYVDDQIATVTSDASSLGSRVGDLEDAVGTDGVDPATGSTVWSRINDLEDGLGGSSDTAAADGTTAWSRLKNAEGDIDALETRAGQIESKLGTADDAANAAGTTAWSRLKNAEADIDTLQGLVGNTAVSTQISNAIAGLDADLDASVANMASGAVAVMTGVTEVDGILTAVDSVAVDPAGTAASAASAVSTNLLGASGDAASANTIFGAKAYADSVATAATEPISTDDLNTLLGITSGGGEG